jgi:phage tail protein X
MRRLRAGIVLVLSLALSGCGYVHFGRLPSKVMSDAKAAEAYSSLATEHKILKQELALARREGDALRVALERAGGHRGNSGDLVTGLNDAARELAALRASYARLQAELAAKPDAVAPASSALQADLEEKLAVSLRNYTQLQEENARLRNDVARVQAENLTLTEQLKSAVVQAEQAEGTISQLNTELLAQKEARTRAEQSVAAVRAQLSTVLAHGTPGPAPTIAPEPAGTGLSALQTAKAPPAGSSAIATLHVNTSQLHAAAAPATPPARVHVVRVGDTLENIARQYYGAPERWSTIYEANSAALANGQPLRAGMELRIPAN